MIIRITKKIKKKIDKRDFLTNQKFNVNEYITLKLENNKTNIYIKNEFFQICKFLLLDISVSEIKSFDDIDSIDEVSEKLDRTMERKGIEYLQIPPEVEFWGHCSNMQVWTENKYNTRLLHRSLAFPLLKKLTEVGDPEAKRVFKEEIGKRIEVGNKTVIKYLQEQGYLNYLSIEEIESVLDYRLYSQSLTKYSSLNDKQAKIMVSLEYTLAKEFYVIDQLDFDHEFGLFNLDYNDCGVKIEKGFVTEIYLNKFFLEFFPELITKISSLQRIFLHGNKLETIPESVANLKDLQILDLGDNHLSAFPQSLIRLPLLENLDLSENRIETIPNSIITLYHMKQLDLSDNFLTNIPESIKYLKSLQSLNLGGNKLKDFPVILTNISSLQSLNLEGNFITNIPDTIKNLSLLQNLNLSANEFKQFPKNLILLKSLKILSLNNNQHISELPEDIGKLTSLNVFCVSGNKINILPSTINKLKNLEKIDLGKNCFKSFPDVLNNLITLKEIDLSENPMLFLPEKKEECRDWASIYACPYCKKKMRFSRGCSYAEIKIDGKWYGRKPASGEFQCDCGAEDGNTHHLGCDMEECPICESQMIWCNCAGIKESIRDKFGNIIYL